MSYNLTDSQKSLARWLVRQVRDGNLAEEFCVIWLDPDGQIVTLRDGKETFVKGETVTKGALDALVAAELLICVPSYESDLFPGAAYPSYQRHEINRRCTITGKAYEAVDSDFSAPDISFVTHLTPLADVTNLDDELKTRCLPMLGAGAANPMMWDSAVRTAGVILEERLRDVGSIADPNVVGRALVNKVFGDKGSLAAKFSVDAERQGYRDLYAGIVGVFRNRYAHRFTDPAPEDGGAFIVFVNLLLKMLEDIR